MDRSMGDSAGQAMHEVAGWVPPLARLGYAAKGVVYALVGGIAIKAAVAAGQPEGATGALASLADEGGGRWLLYLIAFGLACHVLWRVVQALLDPEHQGHDARRVGMRVFYAISAVVYGALALTAWQLARGRASGAGDGQEVWVAWLLGKPFGTWLVMLAGLAVIGYGLQQLFKAWRGDVNRHMRAGEPEVSRGVRAVGRIGTAARGLVLLPVGWFVFNAGRHYRVSEVADTSEVLGMLGHGWLLALVGLGLLAYGLHQLAKAMFRRIGRPA